MGLNPRTLVPKTFSPKSISGLALWLDGSDASSLYTTDAGPGVEAADEAEIAALAGLEAWWDASDESTVTLDSGRLAGLADKSGNGRDAVNTTTGTTQPEYVAAARNGRNVARFDAASTQRLTVNSSQATFKFLHDGTSSYVVAVFSTGFVADPNGIFGILGNNATSTSNIGYILQVDDRSPTFNMTLRSAVGAGVAGQWVAIHDSASAVLPQQTHIAESLIDADNAAASQRTSQLVDGSSAGGANASTTSPSSSNATSNLQIGTSGNNSTPHSGDICEILIFSQQPSASQRARIAKYLAAKWGISNVHAPATSGAPVGYWADKSGNSRHATQATAASRPTVAAMGSRSALRLGASGAVSRLSLGNLSAAFPSAGNVFVAFQPNNDPQYTLYSTRNNDDTYANTSTSLWGTWVNIRTSVTSSRPSSGAHVANLYGAPGLFSVIEDGALIHSSSALTWEPGNDHNIGSRSASAAGQTPLDGWIGEVIAYNRALTASERRRVESYLARRWGITLAPQVANAEAQDWVNRVYAAGSTVSQPVANAVSSFVDGCQADGIWDAMKSVVLLAGADTLAGALAPLKGTAPTSYNFVSGDYSKTSGLVGNGSTKYLDSNRAGNADPQDDNHMAMWVSDVGTTATQSFVGSVATVETYLFKNSSGGTGYLNNNASTGVTAQYPGNGRLLGMSRSQASEFLVRLNGANVTRVSASTGVNSIDAFVFARNSSGAALGHVDSTLAFYSIGESLDLALLDARVSALMTNLGVS